MPAKPVVIKVTISGLRQIRWRYQAGATCSLPADGCLHVPPRKKLAKKAIHRRHFYQQPLQHAQAMLSTPLLLLSERHRCRWPVQLFARRCLCRIFRRLLADAWHQRYLHQQQQHFKCYLLKLPQPLAGSRVGRRLRRNNWSAGRWVGDGLEWETDDQGRLTQVTQVMVRTTSVNADTNNIILAQYRQLQGHRRSLVTGSRSTGASKNIISAERDTRTSKTITSLI